MFTYLPAAFFAIIFSVFKIKQAQKYAWRRNLLAQKTFEEISFDRAETARASR